MLLVYPNKLLSSFTELMLEPNAFHYYICPCKKERYAAEYLLKNHMASGHWRVIRIMGALKKPFETSNIESI